MKKLVRSLLLAAVAMALLLSACGKPYDPSEHAQPAPDATLGVGLTGIDHLADHVSIQNFWVDGVNGAQAGDGGRTVCCAVLPLQWKPGLSVVVRWNITNWRDCKWESHERRVPVERYAKPGQVWVHFLPDGAVRVISSIVGPGNPAYLGPQIAIPDKEPWKTIGWSPHCDKFPHVDAPEVKESLP